MKKFIAALSAVACLASAPAVAGASESGIYVAPRFIYAPMQFDKLKMKGWGSSLGESISHSKGKTDHTFGGAFAIGADLEPTLDVPLRVELEYGVTSRGSAKTGGEYVIDDGAGAFIAGEVNGKQKVDAQTLMFNVYFDIPTETRFSPYITAGLGMAFLNGKSSFDFATAEGIYDTQGDVISVIDSGSGSTGHSTRTNLAWNVGAGVGVELADDLFLDAGYRFVSLGTFKSKTYNGSGNFRGLHANTKTSSLYDHQISVGLRWEFY